MRRFRVSIAGLMALVLFVAVGVAALREASEVWSGVLFALTVAAMAFAGLRAAYRHEGQRAFWAGFAVFGSLYLVLAFAPGAGSRPLLVSQKLLTWLHSKIARDPQTMASVVFSNRVLTRNVYSESWTPPGTTTTVATLVETPRDLDGDGDIDAVVPTPRQMTIAPLFGAYVPVPRQTAIAPLLAFTTVDSTTFVRVGHCLIALLVAMLGGGVARWQWAAGTRSAAPTTPEEPPGSKGTG
jgi:hypothetical protein